MQTEQRAYLGTTQLRTPAPDEEQNRFISLHFPKIIAFPEDSPLCCVSGRCNWMCVMRTTTLPCCWLWRWPVRLCPVRQQTALQA